jgi:signal transduction histidine kinase/ActR/RegA family two-component response regulator
MDHSYNLRIRLLIMSIAILGGLGFLGYLLFTVLVANDNEHRISELHEVKFPVLEQITLLKRDVNHVHESFSTALVLENYFLLEETYEATRDFSDRTTAIETLDPSMSEWIPPIEQAFDRYYQDAKAIAQILIKQPEKTRELEQAIQEVNQLRLNLNQLIDQTLDERRKQYEVDLGLTNENIKWANSVGAYLGTMLILGLILLAWAISSTVLTAINKSDKLKEIFLATMSHELRTPMNGISGAITLLKNTELTDEQNKLLDACRVSELSITTSIDDILEFTGMMSGSITISKQPFSVLSVIDNTIKLFENECETKHLTIQVDKQDAPDQIFLGDQQRLNHVLRHLVGNAVKFSQQGEINISVSSQLLHGESNRELISISIKDNGPGIPEASLKTVLKPFRQIDGSFSRQHQGMGIGLPMCNAIARAMNGKMMLRNLKRGGLEATFQFTAQKGFKSVPSESPPPVVEHDQNSLGKVLIVEDNEVNQLVLKGFIKKLGYTSDSALNGEEAVTKVAEHEYDLILMDCQMPIMDGFEATEKIRHYLADKNHIPIIAVTANAMEGDKERCLEAGMDDYLKKPVSLNLLKTTMQKYTRNTPH